ncbi:MAG: vitamin K epoxide reductase family protein [Flavobacteriaceae bacterium]
MKDTLTYLVQQLLAHNKIDFDKEELVFQIQSHPSYPSLHAITGVLSHFNIDNVALTIPVDKGILEQLPNTFLAQIKTESNKEFVVVKKSISNCTILTSDKKKQKLSVSEFLKTFTGVIVAVEKDELQQTKKSAQNNTLKPLIVLSSILFISLIAYSTNSISFLLYFIFSIIGTVISTSIIQQELGNQTALGSAFCSGVTEKKDCDAVVNSKGATLFSNFKLSDLSFIYFFGLSISYLLLTLLNGSINTLYIISLTALPITAYSIYYQAIVVKKWCLLCLGIVGTLWVQAAIVLVNTNSTAAFSFSTKTVLITSFSFLLIATLSTYLMPKFKSLKELNKTKIDYFKFKRNFNLFNTLLEKSKTYNTSISTVQEIVFGNTKAALNITVITNPFCGHCKGVHTLIEDILKKHSKEVQICVRFNVNTNNAESDVVKITSKLLEIYQTDTQTCLEAMHEVYGKIAPENWIKKWGDCKEKELNLDVLNKENEWCKNNNINFTPEILINGKPYPQEYDRNDLIYFIEDLVEAIPNQQTKTFATPTI